MHEADVARQEKQLADIAKKGFFELPDGSKSSDHEPKKKRVSKKEASPEKAKPEGKRKSKSTKKEKAPQPEIKNIKRKSAKAV